MMYFVKSFETISINRRLLCSIASVILSITLVAVSAHAANDQISQRADVVASIPGGVIVQLGIEDGRTLAAMQTKESFLVQGLDTDVEKITSVRKNLASRDLQGLVTAREFDGHHLPYIDNMVNLIIVADRFSVPDEEILRVLVPGGKAFSVDSELKTLKLKLEKRHPDNTDEWTHDLHNADNNAVSKDMCIDSIKRQQWVGGPRWSRHHDHIAGLTAMVSAGGRIFYVMEEGETLSILLPARYFIIARDAYNGTILWKKQLASWHPHLWPLKSGPAQLPRRLVVHGKRLYLPLGMAEPLSALDVDTGEVLKTFEETRSLDEVVVSDGLIFCLVDPKPELFKSFSLGDAYNSSQRARVERDYTWDKHVKHLVVIDEESGKVQWRKPVVAAPLSLTVGKAGVYFYNGTRIVALDKAVGQPQWQSIEVGMKKVLPIAEAPTLVAYKDVVLFAGANRRMSAYSADTGKQLWEAEHLRGGYYSPQDLFVIDDLVWSGAIDTPRNTGLFLGRDLWTGEPKREIPAKNVPYTFGHHRCHRAKATERFILTSKTGIEFYDIENRKEEVNDWVRGGCLYGIMPANGLIYAPMNSCACHLDSKLVGFNALAPGVGADDDQTMVEADSRLVRGPAFKTSPRTFQTPAWPTFRADNARSGRTSATLPEKLTPKWRTPLAGKLSALSVGYGKVFVAAVDQHCLHALDRNTGEVAWTFYAGGRIDSPPSLYKGFVYFGCADGHVYSLAASDGRLAWRFRVAPNERQLFSYGQLESVWPVNGSVLIKNGKIFCVGGRSSFLDGGLPFVRLDALTGELEAESTLDEFDPKSGKSIQLLSSQSIMPSAIPDILVSDGGNMFMRVEQLSDDGKRIGSIEYDEKSQYDKRHIFSWAGFLEDSWLHRIYMSYGNGKLTKGTYLNWWEYGWKNPDGRILVMDKDRVFSYGLKPKYHAWSSTFLDYQLFSTNKKVETEPITGPTIFGHKAGRTPPQKLRYNWTTDVPFYVRAMVQAADKLVICGPEDILDEKAVVKNYSDPKVSQTLKRQEAILNGSEGSHLWVVATDDGQVLEKHKLPSLPTWDGMAACQGNVYLSTTDGVMCFAGR